MNKNKLNPAMYDLIRNLPSRKCAKAQNAVEVFLIVRRVKVTLSPGIYIF
tara:strand:- start:121 stop:270 length:150 start_codon:yes stop_codon:yes gene_type:complete